MLKKERPSPLSPDKMAIDRNAVYWFPMRVANHRELRVRDELKQAGGFGIRAKKSNTYIVYQNGTMAVAKDGGKIEPGCEIVVPSKAPRDVNAISQWLGIGTSVASLATMFATIANLVK